MSAAEVAGLVMIAVALVAVVAAAISTLVRALAVRRRLTAIAARPAVRAVAGIAEDSKRIAASAAPLRSLGERLDRINADMMDAAAAGARLGLDVRAIAGAVEDLLETLVPSLRGTQA